MARRAHADRIPRAACCHTGTLLPNAQAVRRWRRFLRRLAEWRNIRDACTPTVCTHYAEPTLLIHCVAHRTDRSHVGRVFATQVALIEHEALGTCCQGMLWIGRGRARGRHAHGLPVVVGAVVPRRTLAVHRRIQAPIPWDINASVARPSASARAVLALAGDCVVFIRDRAGRTPKLRGSRSDAPGHREELPRLERIT